MANMLKDSESLFKNDIALDFSYQPKLLLYREKEQRQMVNAIRPLFQDRNGRNVFVWGKPGIGKTLAVRKVLEAIDNPEDDRYGDVSDMVYPIYINCWTKNSSFKIAEDICFQVEYKFTQNKRTDELYKVIENIINRKAAVFVFDEIDKAEDLDFVYMLLERIYKKSMIFITNHKEWLMELEDRIKSRLSCETLEFAPYNAQETRGILEQRKELAFVPGVWDKEAFDKIVGATVKAGDIRSGLYMLREAGLIAEQHSSRKILLEHAMEAAGKLDSMSIKNSDELEDDTKDMLAVVKDASGRRIGELFKLYQEKGGQQSYKTFQRKMRKLEDSGFVSVKRVTGGAEGTTTIITYLKSAKLTDY